MRFKKTIFFSLVILVIFLIYVFFQNPKVNYVALGDSLAAGQNPYGEIGYSYADYIKDYLKKKNRLKEYVKDYAVSGYKSEDIIEDLKDNKKILRDSKEYNIRSLLREADIVTISIGANDFMQAFQPSKLQFDDMNVYYEQVNNSIGKVKNAIKEVRKYAKEKVIVVGYYNPFPLLFKNYEDKVDDLFSSVDSVYQELCKEEDVSYISLYQLFKEHSDYLPNPFDIHPNLQGYSAIARLIIEKELKNL